MPQRTLIVAAALLACWAVAASARDKKERIDGWGIVVNPDHDCSVKLEKGALAVSVPGTIHDLHIDENRMNAPRVMQEIEGDFIIEVRVTGRFAPKVQTIKEHYAYHGAGLVLMKDEKTYLRLERAACFRPDFGTNSMTYISFGLIEDGSPVQTEGPSDYLLEESQMAYLRLERRKDKVAAAVSADGLKWRYLDPKAVLLPAKVQLGVMAVSSAKEPLTSRFSERRVFQQK